MSPKPPPDKADAEPFVLPPVNDGLEKPKVTPNTPKLPPQPPEVAKPKL